MLTLDNPVSKEMHALDATKRQCPNQRVIYVHVPKRIIHVSVDTKTLAFTYLHACILLVDKMANL